MRYIIFVLFSIYLLQPQTINAQQICHTPCQCNAIFKDPGRIFSAQNPAELKWSGRIEAPTPFDPDMHAFVFSLMDANGNSAEFTLPAGKLKQRGQLYLYVNNAAKTIGGIRMLRISPHTGGFLVSLGAHSNDLLSIQEGSISVAMSLNSLSFCAETIWRIAVSPPGLHMEGGLIPRL